MHDCWPVEGAAVLVVLTAEARHDLFFSAPASFLSLSRLTLSLRMRISKSGSQDSKWFLVTSPKFIPSKLPSRQALKCPKTGVLPISAKQNGGASVVGDMSCGTKAGNGFTVPVSHQSGGLLERYVPLGHNQIQSLYP